MAKCHGQEDQLMGCPHLECMDVRREQLWRRELTYLA